MTLILFNLRVSPASMGIFQKLPAGIISRITMRPFCLNCWTQLVKNRHYVNNRTVMSVNV